MKGLRYFQTAHPDTDTGDEAPSVSATLTRAGKYVDLKADAADQCEAGEQIGRHETIRAVTAARETAAQMCHIKEDGLALKRHTNRERSSGR